MLGALLFLIYIIPLAQLIRSYGLNNHGYADDTQFCLSFKKTSDNAIVKRKILNLEKCLCDISVWMSQNKLKLNNDKTEIILFVSKKHLAELNIKSAGTGVSVASEPVRNLGAMFDSQLIMAPQVKRVVKTSSFHLRNIGKARRVLTEDATKTVIQSLVMSRLDTHTNSWETHFPLFNHWQLGPCVAVIKRCQRHVLRLYKTCFASSRRSSWTSCKCRQYLFCKSRNYLQNKFYLKLGLAQMQHVYHQPK